MRLYLLKGIQGHTDDDQQPGTTEDKWSVELVNKYRR
jgi:hypothetical protein